MSFKTRPLRQPALVLLAALILSGCGLELPFVIAATGIGVGTAVAIDRRAATTQVDDLLIESRATAFINKNYPNVHVNKNSFNLMVLLTGEVPDTSVRLGIESGVRALPKVRNVFNQLVIAPNSSATDRAHDTWITTKVKAAFTTDKDINGRDISVVTEAGVVYLMGLVTAAEAERARNYAATDIDGVVKVVTLFEIGTAAPANP